MSAKLTFVAAGWIAVGFTSISIAHAAPLDPETNSVQKICSITDGTFSRTKGVGDLESAVCRLEDRFPGNTSVTQSAQAVLDALEALKTPLPKSDLSAPLSLDDLNHTPDKDPKFEQAIRQLAKTIHAAHPVAKAVDPSATGPTAVALNDYLTLYGSEASRRADPNGFVTAMLNVLSQTPDGKEIVDCFEKKDSADIRKSTFIFKSPEESGGEAGPISCAFNVSPADGAPQMFDKIVTLDVSTSPGPLLVMFGHELKHSCNTPQMLDFEKKAIDLNAEGKSSADAYNKRRAEIYKIQPGTPAAPPPPADPFSLGAQKKKVEKDSQGNVIPQAQLTELAMMLKQAEKVQEKMDAFGAQINVGRAIDELRAYRLTYQLFKEFAVDAPGAFCDDYYESGLFFKKVLSTGDYMAALQDEDRAGTFVHTLIDDYSANAGYSLEDFYVVDQTTLDFKKDPKTSLPVLKPEVKAKMIQEGFNVQP